MADRPDMSRFLGNVGKGTVVLIVILLILAIFARPVRIIDATEVGVKVTLGKVDDNVLHSGVQFYIPGVQKIVTYPTRVDEIDFTATPFTAEGLEVTMDVSVFYHIIPEKAPDVYKKMGTQYKERLTSIAMAVIRDIVPHYRSDDIYNSTARQKLTLEIQKRINEEFKKYGFEVTQVNIKNIQLPEEVVKAIEAKIKAKQEAEQYQYILQKEKLEAERKKVEAEGIAEANRIIAQSIDDNYIKWYYMQTLKQFAESQNNAIIVVPVPSSYYPETNLTTPIQPPMIVGNPSGG